MVIGRAVVYCGNGAAGGGTLNTLYNGSVVNSPSAGCPMADIAVTGIGTLFGVHQQQAGAGLLGAQAIGVAQPGTWAYPGR